MKPLKEGEFSVHFPPFVMRTTVDRIWPSSLSPISAPNAQHILGRLVLLTVATMPDLVSP